MAVLRGGLSGSRVVSCPRGWTGCLVSLCPFLPVCVRCRLCGVPRVFGDEWGSSLSFVRCVPRLCRCGWWSASCLFGARYCVSLCCAGGVWGRPEVGWPRFGDCGFPLFPRSRLPDPEAVSYSAGGNAAMVRAETVG